MVEARRILRNAAFMVGPDSYHRNATDAAIDPFATQFHISSLLERANRKCSSGKVPSYGNPEVVSEAKAILCRRMKVPHISIWEDQSKPKWERVKAELEAVANG